MNPILHTKCADEIPFNVALLLFSTFGDIAARMKYANMYTLHVMTFQQS